MLVGNLAVLDRGDGPAVEVLNQAAKRRSQRVRDETKVELDKVMNKVERTLDQYESASALMDAGSSMDDNVEYVNDLQELETLLKDTVRKKKYQGQVSIFIVGYSDLCGKRLKLIQQVYEFMQDSQTRWDVDELRARTPEFDLDEAKIGIEQTLETASSLATKLDGVHKDMVDYMMSYANSKQNNKTKKKLEKALAQAMADVARISDMLTVTQLEVKEKDEKIQSLYKQLEIKTMEAQRFKTAAEVIKKSSQDTQSVHSELEEKENEIKELNKKIGHLEMDIKQRDAAKENSRQDEFSMGREAVVKARELEDKLQSLTAISNTEKREMQEYHEKQTNTMLLEHRREKEEIEQKFKEQVQEIRRIAHQKEADAASACAQLLESQTEAEELRERLTNAEEELRANVKSRRSFIVESYKDSEGDAEEDEDLRYQEPDDSTKNSRASTKLGQRDNSGTSQGKAGSKNQTSTGSKASSVADDGVAEEAVLEQLSRVDMETNFTSEEVWTEFPPRYLKPVFSHYRQHAMQTVENLREEVERMTAKSVRKVQTIKAQFQEHKARWLREREILCKQVERAQKIQRNSEQEVDGTLSQLEEFITEQETLEHKEEELALRRQTSMMTAADLKDSNEREVMDEIASLKLALKEAEERETILKETADVRDLFEQTDDAKSQRITDVDTPAVVTPLDADVITPLPITPITSATRARRSRTTSGKSSFSAHAPLTEENGMEAENDQGEVTSRKSTAEASGGRMEAQGPEIQEWSADQVEATAAQKEAKGDFLDESAGDLENSDLDLAAVGESHSESRRSTASGRKRAVSFAEGVAAREREESEASMSAQKSMTSAMTVVEDLRRVIVDRQLDPIQWKALASLRAAIFDGKMASKRDGLVSASELSALATAVSGSAAEFSVMPATTFGEADNSASLTVSDQQSHTPSHQGSARSSDALDDRMLAAFGLASKLSDESHILGYRPERLLKTVLSLCEHAAASMKLDQAMPSVEQIESMLTREISSVAEIIAARSGASAGPPLSAATSEQKFSRAHSSLSPSQRTDSVASAGVAGGDLGADMLTPTPSERYEGETDSVKAAAYRQTTGPTGEEREGSGLGTPSRIIDSRPPRSPRSSLLTSSPEKEPSSGERSMPLSVNSRAATSGRGSGANSGGSVGRARQALEERKLSSRLRRAESVAVEEIMAGRPSFEDAELDEDGDMPFPEDKPTLDNQMSLASGLSNLRRRDQATSVSAYSEKLAHPILHDKETHVTPVSRREAATSVSGHLSESGLPGKAPGIHHHPIVLEYLRVYQQLYAFKDEVAKVLLDKDMMSASQVLSELEPMEFSTQRTVLPQIEEMSSSATQVFDDTVQVVLEALTALQQPEYRVSSLYSHPNAGEILYPSARNSVMKSASLHSERVSSAGGITTGVITPTSEGAVSVAAKLRGSKLGKTNSEFEAELAKQTKNTEEAYAAQMRKDAAVVKEMQTTIHRLHNEIARLQKRFDIREQLDSGVDSPVMFTRLDAERNAKKLKKGMNNGKVDSDAFADALTKMDAYVSLPGQRLNELASRYIHHTNMKEMEEKLSKRENVTHDEMVVLERMDKLEQVRELRRANKSEQYSEERLFLASELMDTLEEVERESGIFLIKPKYSMRPISPAKPRYTKKPKIQSETQPAVNPTFPATDGAATVEPSTGVNMTSAAMPSGALPRQPYMSEMRQPAAVIRALDHPTLAAGSGQTLWNARVSQAKDHPHIIQTAEVTTPKIMELDVNRMMYGHNNVMTRSYGGPTPSADLLVNAANSSVRSYMTVYRPVMPAIGRSGNDRPMSGSMKRHTTQVKDYHRGRMSSSELNVRVPSTTPLPPIQPNNYLNYDPMVEGQDLPDPVFVPGEALGREATEMTEREVANEKEEDPEITGHITKIVTRSSSIMSINTLDDES